MGFLDDFDIDLDDYESSGFDIPDGTYAFEVAKSELKEGTQNDEDARHIVVTFALENEEGETQTWNWWLKVPDDPQRPTQREKISMGDWKKWLLGAGFDPSEIGSVGPDEIEGITGTVRLVTTFSKKSQREFQNPRDWTFDTVEEKPKKESPKKASKPKPAPEPDEDDEDEAEAAPRANRARPKANPFAKK